MNKRYEFYADVIGAGERQLYSPKKMLRIDMYISLYHGSYVLYISHPYDDTYLKPPKMGFKKHTDFTMLCRYITFFNHTEWKGLNRSEYPLFEYEIWSKPRLMFLYFNNPELEDKIFIQAAKQLI